MIERIYALGDDAFTNLFEMSFVPIPVLSELENMLLRVQNVTIPGVTTGEYEVHYKTQRVTKPNGKLEDPKEFTFDVRVDRNYLVYKMFVTWRNSIQNIASGSVGTDTLASNNRTDVTVWAVDPSGVPIPNFGSWTFKGAWCKGVGDVSFDYTSGDPITTTITMGYMNMDDTLL
jgi:hypothetical protein